MNYIRNPIGRLIKLDHIHRSYYLNGKSVAGVVVDIGTIVMVLAISDNTMNDICLTENGDIIDLTVANLAVLK